MVDPIVEGVFLGAALDLPFRVKVVQEFFESIDRIQKNPLFFAQHAFFHDALRAAVINPSEIIA